MRTMAVVAEVSPYLAALPIAFLAAAIIAGLVVFFIVRSYSMKYKQVEYPLDQYTKLNLREQQDLFTGSHITRRVIETDRRR